MKYVWILHTDVMPWKYTNPFKYVLVLSYVKAFGIGVQLTFMFKRYWLNVTYKSGLGAWTAEAALTNVQFKRWFGLNKDRGWVIKKALMICKDNLLSIPLCYLILDWIFGLDCFSINIKWTFAYHLLNCHHL